MRYLCLLLVVLLVGCAQTLPPQHTTYNPLYDKYGAVLSWQPSDFPLHVYVDERLSPTRVTALRISIEKWNDKLGCNAFVLVGRIPYYRFHNQQGTVFVTSWDLPDIGTDPGFVVRGEVFTDSDPNEAGRYRSAVLAVDVVTPDIELVVMYEHELGHVLALGHDSNRQSIMYPHLNESGYKFMDYDISFVKEEMGHACQTNTTLSEQMPNNAL